MRLRGPPPDPAKLAAKEAGDTRYFSADAPACARGHKSERLVSNGACSECQRMLHPWSKRGKVTKRGILIA